MAGAFILIILSMSYLHLKTVYVTAVVSYPPNILGSVSAASPSSKLNVSQTKCLLKSTPYCLHNPYMFKSRKHLGLNSTSLLKHQKLDHLMLLVSHVHPDILALSEAWLKKSINDTEEAINNSNLRQDWKGQWSDHC